MKKQKEKFLKHVLDKVINIPRRYQDFSFADRQVLTQYFIEDLTIKEIADESKRSVSWLKDIRSRAKTTISMFLDSLENDLKQTASLLKERDLLQSKFLALQEENKNLRLELGRKLVKEKKFEIKENHTLEELFALGLLSSKNLRILKSQDYLTVEKLKTATRKNLLRLRGFGKFALGQVEALTGPLPKG
jgi:predicted DNA-binding protein YlxM (UPF0122 family)